MTDYMTAIQAELADTEGLLGARVLRRHLIAALEELNRLQTLEKSWSRAIAPKVKPVAEVHYYADRASEFFYTEHGASLNWSVGVHSLYASPSSDALLTQVSAAVVEEQEFNSGDSALDQLLSATVHLQRGPEFNNMDTGLYWLELLESVVARLKGGAAVVGVAEGMVLVPREPTPEMLHALTQLAARGRVVEGYRAMLAASPAAPSSKPGALE